MNSVSIYEKKWLDLVFEGKNKAYGAYQLRLENSRTTLLAFFIGLLLLVSAAGIPVLINLLDNTKISAPAIPDVTIVQVSPTPQMPDTKPKTAVIPPVKKTTDEPEKQLVDREVVKPQNADQNIATNTNNTPTPTPNPTEGTGIPGINPMPAGGTGPATSPDPEVINRTPALDKQPLFPGGMSEFTRLVGKRFTPPEIEGEVAKTLKIYVSFVIEKDGSITDIKVLKDPGYDLGKEAIRVLKSMKMKWEPGMINGQPVRTAYNLPITVNLQ